jgi:hypothetical protein
MGEALAFAGAAFASKAPDAIDRTSAMPEPPQSSRRSAAMLPVTAWRNS